MKVIKFVQKKIKQKSLLRKNYFLLGLDKELMSTAPKMRREAFGNVSGEEEGTTVMTRIFGKKHLHRRMSTTPTWESEGKSETLQSED